MTSDGGKGADPRGDPVDSGYRRNQLEREIRKRGSLVSSLRQREEDGEEEGGWGASRGFLFESISEHPRS